METKEQAYQRTVDKLKDCVCFIGDDHNGSHKNNSKSNYYKRRLIFDTEERLKTKGTWTGLLTEKSVKLSSSHYEHEVKTNVLNWYKAVNFRIFTPTKKVLFKIKLKRYTIFFIKEIFIDKTIDWHLPITCKKFSLETKSEDKFELTNHKL